MHLATPAQTIKIVCRTRQATDTALYMQTLASSPASSYLQRYLLRADLPAPAPVATPPDSQEPPPEAPPPTGTTQDFGAAPSPQSTSPVPGPLAAVPSEPEDTPDGGGGDDGPSTGLVVGGTVAIVAALVICVAIAIYVLALRRKVRRAKAASGEPVRAYGRGHAYT